ncbi:hypothetical protein Leryth_018223 [Lithospermum erythrorhizon]|nr:hypothetical protein Leryth_018223 [Lithospermum erythrorhizon]
MKIWFFLCISRGQCELYEGIRNAGRLNEDVISHAAIYLKCNRALLDRYCPSDGPHPFSHQPIHSPNPLSDSRSASVPHGNIKQPRLNHSPLKPIQYQGMLKTTKIHLHLPSRYTILSPPSITLFTQGLK